MLLSRIEVEEFPHLDDTRGRKLAAHIQAALGLVVARARLVKVFTVAGLAPAQVVTLIEQAALHDPILQRASVQPVATDADWIVEVAYRPGVTDNEGRTARNTAALVLGLERQDLAIYTATQYHLWGKLSLADAERIAKDLLANELIERCSIKSGAEWHKEPGFPAQAAKVTGSATDEVATIALSTMSEQAMLEFSQQNTLALNLEEMQAIKAYYARADVAALRAGRALGAEPTDAELEVLAQTWSEHCKHKIFAAQVDYEDQELGQRESINSLYKTTIQKTTRDLRAAMGEKDFCRVVFSDNAGVVAFNETHDMCIKVETHNSPSALDPYGGALTGIVGVNRDPMGTGLGADLSCNMDVFCFASPFHNKPLPPRLLHPRRVFEGVREGVEHGGNKSGIPTVNGSIVFDERFLGKPLVFCGTVGLIPRVLPDGRKGYSKKAAKGDHIVMVGGRIGKDGIHGATFSSEELHQNSPATAVQIGDPITQRTMYDFIMKARDLGLYSAITDNGAGGLSSSVGEMAQDTGGCRLDVAKAPLKYDGLRPWEILLSEAQERMTLAVPPEKLATLLELARHMDVEATALGEFTDSGLFEVQYNTRPVACLHMDFLHDGVPQLQLGAVWQGSPAANKPQAVPAVADHTDLLLRMLARLNICSREYVIRQYDHEVQGGSVIKPLMGVKRDAPTDAAVVRPLLEGEKGLVLGHGICPKFSDYDTYHMAALAIDEAIRNVVAVGADPERLAGVDNFCWCDPVQSEKTPDGQYKMAQLVRACKALDAYCRAFGVPCVSGKDSMKNDYTGGGQKISIPPTLLFTALGLMDDVNKAQSSDFKQAGDAVYLLGLTRNELGGSEFADELNLNGKGLFGAVPTVDAPSALKRYKALHKAINLGLISACHDLSDGGLAVTLAEMAIGGRLGARINLDAVPCAEALGAVEILYSESASRLAVCVRPENRAAFEQLMAQNPCACIGECGGESLTFTAGGQTVCSLPVEGLATAFTSTLKW